MSTAPLSSLYFVATSLKDGPSTLRSTAWQLMQFFDVARARSAKAGRCEAKAQGCGEQNSFHGGFIS
jgi:hypothetical protein